MAVLQEIKVPLLAVNDTSLTVVAISFTSGQKVKKGDQLMVFETSKTTYEVEAEAEGYVQYFCETGKDYEVNELVAKIFTDASELETLSNGKPVLNGQRATVPAAASASPAQWNGDTLFSAAAEKLLLSTGASRALFSGRDFVSKAEVETLLGIGQPVQAAGNNTAPQPVKAKAAPVADPNRFIVEKLSSGKRREIEYLSEVQSGGLTSTINTFIETGGLFEQVNPSMAYLKDSLLPLVIYETARLLKKYSPLNAYFTGAETAVYKEVNIGFAIDIDKGLKVLKLPRTNDMKLAEIEAGILQLSEKYLDDKLAITDLTDISFTITDLSAEGVSFFRPLVNMMNSAILGIAAIDHQLNRCTVSITFDHRVTEGKLVARFLQELKERIESYRADSRYRTRAIHCFKCYTTLAEDLADVGFVACVQPDGRDGHICQRCFKGF